MPENRSETTWGRFPRSTFFNQASRFGSCNGALDQPRQAEFALPEDSAQTRPIAWLMGLMLAAIFFVSGHDLARLGKQLGDVSEQGNIELLVQEIDSGNRVRQVMFFSFAALGILLLLKQGGNRWQINLPLVALIGATLAWCLLSMFWSSNPFQSLRRVGVVLCCMIGAAGVVRRLSPREFCLMVFTAVFPMLIVIFLLDVAAGSRPWSGTDRFGGTLHPNAMAVYCGVAALAAYVMSWNSRLKTIWLSLFVVCIVLLLLTKSRTTLSVLAVTMAVGWFLSLSSRMRWCWAAGVLTLGAVALLLVGSLGMTVLEPVVDTVLLGRHEKVDSLSGRVPLWEMLLEYARQRPLLGRGFSSFWTTPIIQEVSETQQWAITSAHSAYLELVLGIGLIGMLLAASTVFMGAWKALRNYSQTRDAGYAFILLLLVFGLANGALESIFVKPQFTTILAFCGLAMVAFFASDAERGCTDAAR